MKTFDDFTEARPAGPPIETESAPAVGELIDGKKVLRFKAIGASQVTQDAIDGTEVDPNLKFKRHHSRPFVFWLAETK